METVGWNKNVWFSPRYAINYFWDIARKVGKVSIKSNKYKKEREAWITAVALLAINKETGRTWWLQIPQSDPPDISCMTMIKKGNINELNQQDVEVMEITKQSPGTIAQEIKKKLSDKFYPSRYVLIAYLRRTEEIEDLRIVAEEIRSLIKPRISSVWCIGNLSPVSHDYTVFSLFPDVKQYCLNIIEECNKLMPGDFATVRKAKEAEWKMVKSNKLYKFVPGSKGK